MKIQFSSHTMLAVLRILNTCVLDFALCLSPDHMSSWLFLRFLICGLVQVLFLSLALNF
jgi:hypothetical protein